MITLLQWTPAKIAEALVGRLRLAMKKKNTLRNAHFFKKIGPLYFLQHS